MKRAAVFAAVALLCTTQAHAMIPEDQDHNDDSLAAVAAQRRLIKSARGLQSGDSWIAEVEGGSAACNAVAAAADAWKRDNLFGALSVGATNHDARTIAMRKTCFVTFTGPQALADYVESDVAGVLSVEPDLVVVTEAAPASWGLDRIDQSDLPLSRTPLTESHDGIGVNIYVIDTGINVAHAQFGGRAQYGANFISGESAEDGNGHGSHTAGTAAGATYGIARRATVFGVKVLSSSGSGSTSGVIDGINWAVQNQIDNYNGESAVLSMSLGGSFSSAMNRAVELAADEGMIVVVAAGNENQDACNVSPAAAGGSALSGGVVSVGSTTSSDTMSSFSNYGSCTDVFAPGSDITSAWKGTSTASRTISGTSMATPHVAGVAAILLQKHDKDKGAAQSELMSLLVPGKISSIGKNSPNLLLQVPTYTGPPTPPTPAPTMPPTREPERMCVGSTCVDFAMSSFGPGLPARELVVAPLAVATADPTMCTATSEDLSGKVVIVKRGDCLFFDKVKNAELQGARAVLIMLTSSIDLIFAPGYYGTDSTDIPSAMISYKDGKTLSGLVGSIITLGSPSNTPAPVGPTNSPTTARPTVSPTRRPTATPTERPTPLPTTSPTPRPTVSCGALRRKACRKRDDCAWTKVLDFSDTLACYDKASTPPPTPLPKLTTPSGCQFGSHADAVAVCAALDLNLCTLQQLRDQPLEDAGCGFDSKWVWSADACSGKRHRIFKRNGKKSVCRPSTRSMSIRCC